MQLASHVAFSRSGASFWCDQCHNIKTANKGEIGYGIDTNGDKICYDCCGVMEAQQMLKTGKIMLYLTCTNKSRGAMTTNDFDAWREKNYVSNWPGSLKIKLNGLNIGRHNIAGKRYDVWFTFKGQQWHGVTYGDNTQICHCKRTKG